MDLKRLRELQESLEVYGELDEGATEAVAARASKLARQRSGQTPERKAMYSNLATQATKRSYYGSGSPFLSRFEKSQMHGIGITPASSQRSSETETLGGGTYVRGPKRLPKSQEKYRRQVLSGVRTVSAQERERLGIGESYNIYDILISHLLDEGYAEDVKNAYCILENMSEDWVLEILDEVL